MPPLIGSAATPHTHFQRRYERTNQAFTDAVALRAIGHDCHSLRQSGRVVGQIQFSGRAANNLNASHIVKCVNLHEELVDVLERLICLSHVPERLQDDEWEKSLALCLETLNKAQQ